MNWERYVSVVDDTVALATPVVLEAEAGVEASRQIRLHALVVIRKTDRSLIIEESLSVDKCIWRCLWEAAGSRHIR